MSEETSNLLVTYYFTVLLLVVTAETGILTEIILLQRANIIAVVNGWYSYIFLRKYNYGRQVIVVYCPHNSRY